MNRRKQYCINSIKALITAIAIILTSALSCVPACADTNDNSERIFYQFEEDNSMVILGILNLAIGIGQLMVSILALCGNCCSSD